jgi:hypothetical protein
MPRSEPRPARDGDRRTNAITPAPRHPRESPDCKITICRQRTPPTGTSTEIHSDRGGRRQDRIHRAAMGRLRAPFEASRTATGSTQ